MGFWSLSSMILSLCLIRSCPKIPVKLNSSRLKVFGLDHFGLITCERWDLCWSATLPWIFAVVHGSCAQRLGCEGENDWKIGEVGERELVLVVRVKCGKERDMTREWQLCWDTNTCNPELCALEPRVFAWWNVIILFSVCADTLCASVHGVWVGVLFTHPVGCREVYLPANRNLS